MSTGTAATSSTSTTTDERLARRTREMLQAHVPLALLLDIADPAGPESSRLYEVEGGDADWVRR